MKKRKKNTGKSRRNSNRGSPAPVEPVHYSGKHARRSAEQSGVAHLASHSRGYFLRLSQLVCMLGCVVAPCSRCVRATSITCPAPCFLRARHLRCFLLRARPRTGLRSCPTPRRASFRSTERICPWNFAAMSNSDKFMPLALAGSCATHGLLENNYGHAIMDGSSQQQRID